MNERLTDEQVWLQCYCCGVVRGLESRAVEVASRGVEEFRKQFPKTTTPEPRLTLHWNDRSVIDCGVNYTSFEATNNEYDLTVQFDLDEWEWTVNHKNRDDWHFVGHSPTENMAKICAERVSSVQRVI